MVGTGRHVQKIQQALVDEGLPFRQHGVDGQYGPETADAVGQVQAGSTDPAIRWRRRGGERLSEHSRIRAVAGLPVGASESLVVVPECVDFEGEDAVAW